MRFQFNNLKISGVFVVLPEKEYLFEDDMHFNALSEKRNRALATMMGYERHRFFKSRSCTSEVVGWGLTTLFEKQFLQKDEIVALIVSNMSPDFIMPGTSKIIAKICGLQNDILTIDINEACVGFVNGLFHGFNILNSLKSKGKVILVNGDCFGKEPDRSNTTSYPLAGEAISLTVLERTEVANQIFYDGKSDFKYWEALVYPDYGFRKLSKHEQELLSGKIYANNPVISSLHMDGQSVFNYVLQDVFRYLVDFLDCTQTEKKDIDYFFFHQPNNFMLEKLAQSFEIISEKMPKDVVKYYGNSNSATIPVCMVHNARNQLLDDKIYKCLFSAFGAGLSYAAILMDIGKMDFCEMIVSEF